VPAPLQQPPVTPAAARTAGQLAVVVAATFLAGVVTFSAQGFLPDSLQSFANSASGWTLVTAGLVWALRPAPVTAAVLGAVGFVLLTLGYTAAAAWQGLYYDPRFFSAVGLLVGPFVGLAATWLHRPGLPAAAGAALLAGIGIGESAYGLLYVSDTTSPVYWAIIGVLGLALLVHTAVRRSGRPALAVAACAGCAVIATAFVLVYSAL
jgi:hypothetical protein